MAKTRARTVPREYQDPKWDLETLTRAEQIKADAKRLAAAQKEAEKQSSALKSIARVKASPKASLARRRI